MGKVGLRNGLRRHEMETLDKSKDEVCREEEAVGLGIGHRGDQPCNPLARSVKRPRPFRKGTNFGVVWYHVSTVQVGSQCNAINRWYFLLLFSIV